MSQLTALYLKGKSSLSLYLMAQNWAMYQHLKVREGTYIQSKKDSPSFLNPSGCAISILRGVFCDAGSVSSPPKFILHSLLCRAVGCQHPLRFQALLRVLQQPDLGFLQLTHHSVSINKTWNQAVTLSSQGGGGGVVVLAVAMYLLMGRGIVLN